MRIKKKSNRVFVVNTIIMAAIFVSLIITKPVHAASSKISMYVISKVSVTTTYTYDDIEYSTTNTSKCTYNKKGLLKKIKCTSNLGDDTYKYNVEYTYTNEGHYKAARHSGKGYKEIETYSRDAQGRVIKADNQQSKPAWNIKYNGKGLCVRLSEYDSFNYNGKGYLKKEMTADGAFRSTHYYDNRGTNKTIKQYDSSEKKTTVYKFKNTYKNGRLAKQSVTQNSNLFKNWKSTIQYSYKKISVPAKYYKKAKLQKKWIILGGGTSCDYCQLPLIVF